MFYLQYWFDIYFSGHLFGEAHVTTHTVET